MNRECDFTRGRPLPILGVDEPIYRRLPCFLIATVDKFAAMPWTGEVGGLLREGGACTTPTASTAHAEPAGASCLDKPLPPPDLVIQDELHLISGPMGTMVGLYETALEALCVGAARRHSRSGRRSSPRPPPFAAPTTRSAVCSTARTVDIFPPPGPDRRDSFFAGSLSEESKARLYLGVAAQGRSPKVVLLRTYLALLGAAQKAYLGLWRKASAGQRRRSVHDSRRLLQQPAGAGRNAPHRRG